MKKILSYILLAAVSFCAFAEIETFSSHYEPVTSAEEFDVTYFQHESMKISKLRRAGGIPVTQAFTVDNGLYEERFTLFKDTGSKDKSRKMEYAKVGLEYASKAAGRTLTASDFVPFKDADVEEEFGGDFGHTCFVVDPPSSYAKGYKYMLIEFFCKESQGIVMRTILTDDETVFTEPAENFIYTYHSFRFNATRPRLSSSSNDDDEDTLFW
ncbi:MAG: hypothetical protein J6P07_04525 [Spirochaetaceae bacterium]|nr:hypothetical protein [Spirochaetaceae bacterium]